jgi:enamine deaminase RidA (YjgF/YER057c/UK114 family)
MTDKRGLGPIVYGGREMVWGKGAKAGGFVFLSGVEGRVDDEGRPVAGVAAQTELCLERTDARLREAGATLDDAVKFVWYVTERDHLPEFFETRDRWLEARYPALLRDRSYASTVAIAGLSYEDVLVEIDCIAYRGPDSG